MSDAKDRLAKSRMAIIEQIARKERRHDPREAPRRDGDPVQTGPAGREPSRPPRSAGWLARAKFAANTWWRHHPAHMAAEVAGPLLASYGRANPGKFLGIAAVTGAVLMFSKPWKLISLTTIAVAVLKSSHLPSVLMSAMSAADFEHDHEGPG